MTPDQLLRLAQAYSAATGVNLTDLSCAACGSRNNKLFRRIERDLGINTKTIERASLWFADNWPAGTQWPEGVPRPQVRTAA